MSTSVNEEMWVKLSSKTGLGTSTNSWRIRVEIPDFHYTMVSDPAGGGSFSSATASAGR